MRHRLVLLPVLVATLVCAPPALAWTWPADGPVLQPFVLGGDPYAAGQHRGIDVAGPPGAAVRAPTGGVVSFAGFVPSGGRTVTIQTADGLAVTLLHLGSVGVARGAAVTEDVTVGTLALAGDADHAVPYVQMGVRVAADPQGYLDPLAFLPQRVPSEAPAAPVEEPAAGPVDDVPVDVPAAAPELVVPPVSTAVDPDVPVGSQRAAVPTSVRAGGAGVDPPVRHVRVGVPASPTGVRPRSVEPGQAVVEVASPQVRRIPAEPSTEELGVVVSAAARPAPHGTPAVPVAAVVGFAALVLAFASLAVAQRRRGGPTPRVWLPPRVTPRLCLPAPRVRLPGSGSPDRRQARSGPHADSALVALVRRARRRTHRATR